MVPFARILILIGAGLIVAGLLVLLASRLGLELGRLPGDIRIERGNSTCVIALGISIMLSILLTIVVNLVARFLNK